jgi:tRNA-Thr(GGU) m(6)t(6)A37 methyltransferase TsaA
METFTFNPIGYFYTDAKEIPKHYTASEEEGKIVLDKIYTEAASDILPGERIIVIFVFHKSPPFTLDRLKIVPFNRTEKRGLFSTASPVRPNPIGVSILTVEKVEDNVIYVKNIDMLNGTPILDIKVYK